MDSNVTKIKLCGLRRMYDIECVNELMPEYIGFIFAKKSKRYVTFDESKILKNSLNNDITAVGVFVDEDIDTVVNAVNKKIIDAIQLHGNEDEEYIYKLRSKTKCTIIKAFKIQSLSDIDEANKSSADYVLLDSGGGTGESFDWSFLQKMKRKYFLAGGLTPENVGMAINTLTPFAVDASSSLEIDGCKDKEKMKAFVDAVRMEEI